MLNINFKARKNTQYNRDNIKKKDIHKMTSKIKLKKTAITVIIIHAMMDPIIPSMMKSPDSDITVPSETRIGASGSLRSFNFGKLSSRPTPLYKPYNINKNNALAIIPKEM